MAKKSTKYTKEELNALKINALLQGKSVEELQAELAESIDLVEPDDDIVIEDEEDTIKSKKSGKKSSKKKKEEAPVNTGLHIIPDLDKYTRLNTNLQMNVTYNEHDIHYKEQVWGMDARTLTYKLELIKQSKPAANAASLMCKKSPAEIKKAEDGKVRYFRLVCYDENIFYMLREIAYVRVEINDNGKKDVRIVVNSNVLSDNHANPEKVKSNLTKLVKDIIK